MFSSEIGHHLVHVGDYLHAVCQHDAPGMISTGVPSGGASWEGGRISARAKGNTRRAVVIVEREGCIGRFYFHAKRNTTLAITITRVGTA